MNEITPLKSKVRSWGERIKTQAQSGKSVRVFCEEHQLSRHTFCYWKKKLRDLPSRGLAKLPNRFISISRATHSIEKTPRIYLPNGVQIDLGAGLESVVVHQLIQKLCGIGHEKS